MTNVILITNLSKSYGETVVFRDFSARLPLGETTVITGVSGGGKTTLLRLILGLETPDGGEIAGVPARRAAVFQEDRLCPQLTVLENVLLTAGRKKEREARDLLARLGLGESLAVPAAELSGGMRQRVMIAMAIANKPKLLIADEPTTALDVTIQAQIIDLLIELKQKLNMSILFISHDLKLVRQIADRVCVMKNGEIVEQGAVEDFFRQPQHDYTKLLVSASMLQNESRPQVSELIVKAENLRVSYPLKKNFLGRTTSYLNALDQVNLDIQCGECLGIVGESGSGKTTLGMALAGLIKVSGDIFYKKINMKSLSGKGKKALKQKMQIVFQDPYNSLNPRMTIEDIVSEGLIVHYPELSRAERRQRAAAGLEEVGLGAEVLRRYPHEFSGGQRQRIAIARALVLKPEFIILDEPTSALDVTIQAQIIKLLQDIRRQRNITYLFISHDMKAVRAMADRIAVMKDGKIVELNTSAQIFTAPQNDYTKLLIEASL